MAIKNIIFDLGGVILNINYNLTINTFKELGINDFDTYYTQAKQSNLFDDIETGKISPLTFFNKIQQFSSSSISIDQIENAWNAMLLDLPIERIDLLKKVGKNYNIFLLSNTNEIHYKAYINYIKQDLDIDFNNLFQKSYYSHQIGKRKPNKDCFDFVLNENKLINNETLFIDDSIQHIESAKSMGIATHHLIAGSILDLFDKNGYLIS